MKFLCLACDSVMTFAERQLPGDGTMTAVFTCGSCGREVAMLANAMETQLVSSLGIQVGGRSVPVQPMELVRTTLASDGDAFVDTAGSGLRVTWTEEAAERLARVPTFVRGMVKRIYADYARERGIAVISPDVMDRARAELGLEGM